MTEKYTLGRYIKSRVGEKKDGFFIQEPGQGIEDSELFDTKPQFNTKPQILHGNLDSLETTPELVKRLKEIDVFKIYDGKNVQFFNARKNFHVEYFEPRYDYIITLIRELAKIPVKRLNPEITDEDRAQLKV